MISTGSLRRGVDLGCRIVVWSVLLVCSLGAPWYFGGAPPEAQAWLVAAAFLGACCALLRLAVAPAATLPRPALTIPTLFGLALLLGWLQITPVPRTWHQQWSPQAASWLDQLPEVHAGVAEFEPQLTNSDNALRPLSLAPRATRHTMALLVFSLAVYLLAHCTISTPAARWGWLILLSLNGAALALLGIAQQLTRSDRLFWQVPVPEGAVPFASYVNRNNGAGYLNLALGAALGVLFWAWLRERFEPQGSVEHQRGRHRVRRAGSWTEWLAQLDAWGLSAIGVVVVLISGVLSTASRGGAVALLLAACGVCGLLIQSGRRRAPLAGLVLCGLLAAGAASWLGGGERTVQRFVGMLHQGVLDQDSRWVHWQDGWRAAGAFWRIGSGLGTYRYAYDAFEDRAEPQWYHHAENQYLESLVEVGFLGPVLLLAAIAATAMGLRRAMRRATDPETYAFAVAGMFALISQVVHAGFDFGLYLPANAATLAIFCGAVAGGGRSQNGSDTYGSHHASRRVIRWWLALFVLAAGSSGWAAREMRGGAEVAKAAEGAREEFSSADTDISQLRAAMDRLEQMTVERPDDMQLHEVLAQHWTTLFRLEAARVLQGQVNQGLPPERLWPLTSPALLHARVYALWQAKQHAQLQQLCADPQVRNLLGRALSHWIAARNSCPVRPQVHLAIAQLSPLLGEPGSDHPHVDYAVSLAHHDPDVLFHAGRLHLQAGRLDEGIRLWQASLAGTSQYRAAMLHLGPQLIGPVDFFEKLFAGMPQQLIEVAHEHYGGTPDAHLRYQLADLAEQQLDAQTLPAVERARWMAHVAWLRDDLSTARSHFERAITLCDTDASLHSDFASLLMVAGDPVAAGRHARRCVQLQPGVARYEKQMQEVRRAVRERVSGTAWGD